MGINPVGSWDSDPDFESQVGTTYKGAIDNTIRVGKRIADAFAPREKNVPDLNVLIDAGAVLVGQVLTEKAQQTVGPFTAPVTNPRIDRIVVDLDTGVTEIVAGTEAVTPSPPTIPTNKTPICQVSLVVSQASITNQNITDERIAGGAGRVLVMLDGGVNKVNRTTAVGFTDVNISADTGGDTAKFALLQVTGDIEMGTTTAGQALQITSRFRKNGSVATANLPRLDAKIRSPATGTSQIIATQTITVELDAGEIFEYDLVKTGTPDTETFRLIIDLVGYFK